MRNAFLSEAIWYSQVAGDVFIRSGDAYGGMFGIATGVAEVSFLDEHPDTPALHIVRLGFWAGYRPLIGRSRDISVRARTDLVWALVPQAALERMLAAEPGWWRYLMELSEDNVETVSWAFADLTFQGSLKRAVAVLLRLGGCRTSDVDPAERIAIDVAQGELAAMSAMSRNTLNRALGRLEEAGLISVSYRSIQLRDPAALRALLED
jgi:CRP-like cAMP-binding protein